MSFWSSLPGGPTAIRSVTGRSTKYKAPEPAAKNNNPMASSSHEEILLLRTRGDTARVPPESSDEDIAVTCK
jgi:hypothetical protein